MVWCRSNLSNYRHHGHIQGLLESCHMLKKAFCWDGHFNKTAMLSIPRSWWWIPFLTVPIFLSCKFAINASRHSFLDLLFSLVFCPPLFFQYVPTTVVFLPLLSYCTVHKSLHLFVRWECKILWRILGGKMIHSK